MNETLKNKLDRLNADYASVTGHLFHHFFCPILFKDDEVPLCRAHVINQAFQNVTRVWTVQRQDVDNFYGSNFEADFVLLQDADLLNDDIFFYDVFAKKDLYRKFSPKIVMDGQEVDHFVFTSNIPEHFTPLVLQKDPSPIKIGLKMSPDDVVASVDKDWVVEVSKDVRIPSVVSVIKAAHLSLFELIGYRYALSAAGEFMGRQILGKFFQQNRWNGRTDVIGNAQLFFKEFEHMVRPLEILNIDVQGTVTDRILLACRSKNGSIWATIVLIRIGHQLHGVIVPVTEDINLIQLYFDFLKNADETLSISFCKLEDDHWEIAKSQTSIGP